MDGAGFDHGWPYWPKETMTRLRPHGFTVLVKPDPPPERTDSGAIILPEDQFFIPTSGTVVAVGKGSKRLWETRAKAYWHMWNEADKCVTRALVASGAENPYQLSFAIMDQLRAVRDIIEPAPSVSVGERVVFAAEAGLTIADEDGSSYILLDEDRIAIIVEESVA